jgi:hypothetical protein
LPNGYKPGIEFDGSEGTAQTPGLQEGADFKQYLQDAGFDLSTVEVIGAPRLSRWQVLQGGEPIWLTSYRFRFRILTDALDLPLLYKEAKPARFYGFIAVALAATGLLLGAPLISTYLETGLVPRLPTAVLVMGLLLMATISLTAGVILDSVARLRTEQKRLAYLALGQLPTGHAGPSGQGPEFKPLP